MNNPLLIKDINYIKKTLPAKHVDLYSLISREEFNQEIQSLIGEVSSKKYRTEYFDITLQKIFSRIKDPDTNIYVNNPRTPVYFEYVKDGYYPFVINVNSKEYLGKKLIEVEGFIINKFTHKLENYIIFNNDELKHVEISRALQNYKLVKYLSNIKTKSIKYTFENGKSIEVNSNSDNNPIPQTSIYRIPGNEWLNGKKNYYIQKNNDSLYLKYSRCREDKTYSFEKLLKDIKKKLDTKPNKIIVDLRNNPGGNSSLFDPIVEIFESYIENNTETEIYCLINRRVFSSGILNTYEMRNKLKATLIGQPTGQGVNHYGETNSFNLPNSKLEVQYSSKFFKIIDDSSNSIKPDVLIEPSIDDYMKGNDPVLHYCFTK
jgi:hypothetical protein